MKKFVLILSAFLFIVITSCKKKDAPNPVTIFHDDFNNNNNNWFIKDNDTAYAEVSGGYYFLENRGAYPAYGVWNDVVFIDQSKNFSIKASVNYVLGVQNYGFGLIWGATGSNYYSFLICEEGGFLVEQYKNGTLTILKNWTTSSAIDTSTTSNLLEIRKEGNTDIFNINGQQVFTMPHQPFYGEAIGFKTDNYVEMAVDYVDISQW